MVPGWLRIELQSGAGRVKPLKGKPVPMMFSVLQDSYGREENVYVPPDDTNGFCCYRSEKSAEGMWPGKMQNNV